MHQKNPVQRPVPELQERHRRITTAVQAVCHAVFVLTATFAGLMTTPEQVVVHPLVLLSVVDHYNRVAKDTRKRVIGLLLGETSKGRTDVTNSFAGAQPLYQHPNLSLMAPATPAPDTCCRMLCHAVPFEEDDRDPSIWFLDHSYLENMFDMYKRVNGACIRARPPLRGTSPLGECCECAD